MIIEYTEENLENTINKEVKLLDTIIANNKIKSKILLINFKSTNNSTDSHFNSKKSSTKLKKYLESVENLKKLLVEILELNKDNNLNRKIEKKIKSYNKQYDALQKENSDLLSSINAYVSSSIKSCKSNFKKLTKKCKTEGNVITDNNTLIISEIKNKVFLPYTINELETILSKTRKYKSLQQIISDLYVLPMDKYRYATSSRFKETYNLMRKKEKASVGDSLSVSIEQAFNGALNPAIITACKNLDELDVYLDCLENNETDKFTCFEIKYEVLPTQ